MDYNNLFLLERNHHNEYMRTIRSQLALDGYVIQSLTHTPECSNLFVAAYKEGVNDKEEVAITLATRKEEEKKETRKTRKGKK